MSRSRVVVRVNNIRRAKRTVRALKGAHVGYLRETTGPKTPYSDRETGRGSNVTLATNAFWHEHGTRHMPPRPFMRKGAILFIERRSELKRILARGIAAYSARAVNAGVGALLASSIQRALRDGPHAALSPATIARKGSSKPLIDTGMLHQGVDSRPKR